MVELAQRRALMVKALGKPVAGMATIRRAARALQWQQPEWCADSQ
jgi:hypothetical protein